MSRLVLAVWLVIVWVALWGELSVANVLSGLAVAAMVLIAFPAGERGLPRYIVRPIAVSRLLWYFLSRAVMSNLAVARAIVSRDDRVRTAIVAVPLVSDSDGLLTIVSNLTALTPGMMAIEVERDPALVYIHVVQLDDTERVRADVQELERLVVEAFGAPDAVAAVRASALLRVRGDGP